MRELLGDVEVFAPMKVVVIWHAGALHSERLERMAEQPGVEISAIVPTRWSKGLVKPVLALDCEPQSYNLVPAKALLRFREVLHFYPSLFRVLSREKPDAIYAIEEHYSLITYLALLWRERRSPDTTFLFRTWQNINKEYPVPFRWTERYVLSRSDGATSANHEGGEILDTKGLKGALRIIPDGVDCAKFQPGKGVAVRKDISPDTPLLGYVGRLVTEKGIDLLLHAMSKMDIDCNLLIVGAGPEESALKDLADQLSLADRIIFKPPVDRNEMPEWMGALDVLVLPSRTCPNWKEQFGMVLAEGMASGVPVIGSDSGEIPHVIGDAGLVFPENETGALTECLARLLCNDDLRQSLGTRARQRALKEYSAEMHSEKVVSFIRELVEKRKNNTAGNSFTKPG